MNIRVQIFQALILCFYIIPLRSMQQEAHPLTIQTNDGFTLSWQMPLFIKYCECFQNIELDDVVEVPFSKAALNTLAYVLSMYDKDPTPEHLKALIGHFIDDSCFPVSKGYIWFRLVNYFRIPLAHQLLVELIDDRMKQGNNGISNHQSGDQSWREFPVDETLSKIDIKLLHTISARNIYSIKFSSNGSRIIARFNRGYGPGTIGIWDTGTGRLLHALDEYGANISTFAMSPDDSYIVTGSNRVVKIWNMQGQLLQTLSDHKDHVTVIAVSSDSSFIVTGSWDKTIKIWKVKTGQFYFSVELMHTLEMHSMPQSVAINPDKLSIITSTWDFQAQLGCWDKSAKIWSIKTGKLLHELVGHSAYINSIWISSDSSFIMTGSIDGIVKIWNARTNEPIGTIDGYGPGHKVVISALLSPDDSFIVTASIDDIVRIWDTETAMLSHTLSGHEGYISSVVISPDSSYIVTGSKDLTARVWNSRTGTLLAILQGHKRSIKSLAISPNSSCIVTGSQDDGTARIWKLEDKTASS